MRNIIFILLVSLIWFGCTPRDEMISFDPNLSLVFSNDSVAFDTLLSQRKSSTQRLIVYNPNKMAIQFSEIALGKADQSDYNIIINGRKTNALVNGLILGGDSLMVLVEVNVALRNKNLPYLVKDSIIFRWNTNEEHVKLVSYGQDAKTINKSIICNETWTKDRPYIVKGEVEVSPGCQLTIDKGTKIFFEKNAGIFVRGTLKAIGDSLEHIIFKNTRFDGIYNQVPGQWNGIYFLEGSTSNEVSFAEIFNGQVGFRVTTPDDDDIPDLIISNTEIYNMTLAGILAETADIDITNTLIYNCGKYLMGGFGGGNYTLKHCTLSNEPALFMQDAPTVQFSNNKLKGDNELNVEITNSIIWGAANDEFLINSEGGAKTVVNLTANIIRSGKTFTNNFTSQAFNFPGFKNASSNDYQLDVISAAKDMGVNIGVPKDIVDRKRNLPPDIGAFEYFKEK